jgi:hypothetical protein
MTRKLASQRQVLAKISLSDGQAALKLETGAFASAFAQVSGGEISAAVEKVYRGGQLFPETLCAPAEIGDITLTDFVDADASSLNKDIQTLRQYVGRARFNITVTVYDCDIAVPGTSRYYDRALLVGLTEADGDSSSGAPATFAMTFSVATVGVPVTGTPAPAAPTAPSGS